MSELKDMIYISRDVGGALKSSKHQFVWGFTLDDKRILIHFYISYLTHKKKIIYNQKVIREEDFYKDIYSYEFAMDGHNYKVVQTYDTADLFVDSESFQHFYNLEKTKQAFLEEKNPNINRIISDYNIDEEEVCDNNIQRSNEINFSKQDKEKQKKLLNFSFKKNSGNENGTKKENNLYKYKFSADLNQKNFGNNNNNNFFNNQNNNNNNNNNNTKNNNLMDFDCLNDNNNNLNLNNNAGN